MIFRKSKTSDVKSIMKIIRQAQEFFKNQEIDQWQDGYPNEYTIIKDINNAESYVIVKDDEVVATSMVTFKNEPSYDSIYEGQWLSNNKYATIHRVAVSNTHKGLGLSTEIIKYIEDLCIDHDVHSIKVDTHKENIPMQKTLKKNGFEYCGIIYVDNSSERLAFEKLL
ncbi:GNAT family N-acetyltransferase [Terribacillus saccharophilus]|uniref:GNAT family N-acetyltransferase n=1 Tax=Terribacillus saccharophilus TaxID=361277 RepID=UPI000BA6A989|nr:GNAT family N-acetyltransferase [Terribacillus saccharophilus]PAF18115.1 GNAT family N-acetyltransferase [Terribacillus saccharophilus]